MANGFSKEERFAFLEMCKGMEDALVISGRVSKYSTDSTQMERSGDVIWRPYPYIMNSYDGLDQTSNFDDVMQIAVPATLGFSKSVPWLMSPKELRDSLQNGRLGVAARQKLASDINLRIMNTACYQGTVFVKRSSAAAGFDDVAAIDNAFNRIGVPMDSRTALYESSHYNSMASNLAARETLQGMTSEAFRRAYVGNVAGFETFKLDTALRLTAAAGTTVTINGANQYHVPAATSTAASGEISNVDNRTMTLAITVGGGTVKVGDAFTIADVYEVHAITKQATANLKTFRITEIVTGAGGTGTVKVSPAIISATGGTRPELQYQNVDSAPANGAALVFLNTVTNYMNPFFHEDAIELLGGRYEVETGSGVSKMEAVLENGVGVLFTKSVDHNTLNNKYRMDAFFGAVNKQPEMSGIEMFSQS